MPISAALLPEFDREIATARTVIERLPEDKYGWAPHEKSMKAGRLASHIAEMTNWGTVTMHQDSIDVAPVGGPPMESLNASSKAELLEAFDKNAAACRAAIAGGSDESFMKPWSLLSGGKTLMTMPKVVVMRNFVLNHIIHHHGQLSVYLRMVGAKVPSIYGPSADEGSM